MIRIFFKVGGGPTSSLGVRMNFMMIRRQSLKEIDFSNCSSFLIIKLEMGYYYVEINTGPF